MRQNIVTLIIIPLKIYSILEQLLDYFFMLLSLHIINLNWYIILYVIVGFHLVRTRYVVLHFLNQIDIL